MLYIHMYITCLFMLYVCFINITYMHIHQKKTTYIFLIFYTNILTEKASAKLGSSKILVYNIKATGAPGHISVLLNLVCIQKSKECPR